MSLRNHVLAILAFASALSLLGGSPPQTQSQPGESIRTSGWLMGSWTHRIRLTVKPDSIQGSGVLLDFPMLLTLNASQNHVFAGANANGSDLVITKGDGVTVLGHEVVTFDPVAKKAEIWFRADSLSKAKHDFYLYYGNPTHTSLPAPGVAWHSRYLAVYHFSENPGLGILKDWSPRGNHGNAAVANSNWTAGDVAAGQVGQAWNFNGTSHYIQAFGISTPDTSYVISAWLKVPSLTTDFTFHANPGYWHVSAQINETHRQPHFNAANPWRDLRWGPRPLPNDDLYHQFTWVFDGDADTILFYFDGVQQAATAHAIDPGVKHFYTGYPINPLHNQGVGILGPMYWNQYDLMTGPGDEFRLTERTQSAEWIRTAYRNQRDAAGFYVLGPEEEGGSVPVVLLRFNARRTAEGVELDWEVDSSDDLAGFWVFRGSLADRQRVTPTLLTGGPRFTWTDLDPPAEGTEYWLGEVSRTGDLRFWGPITAEAAVPGAGSKMGRAWPNPFSGETRLSLSANGNTRYTVRIIDMTGRAVITLFDAVAPAGNFQVSWSGQDGSGRRVAPGVYFFSIASPATTAARKVLLLP